MIKTIQEFLESNTLEVSGLPFKTLLKVKENRGIGFNRPNEKFLEVILTKEDVEYIYNKILMCENISILRGSLNILKDGFATSKVLKKLTGFDRVCEIHLEDTNRDVFLSVNGLIDGMLVENEYHKVSLSVLPLILASAKRAIIYREIHVKGLSEQLSSLEAKTEKTDHEEYEIIVIKEILQELKK
jgi:hypothetical protein